MKKILTLIALLAAITVQAQIPSYVPTNGLVGYWPFNGNANDESGNGLNGTIVGGATLTSDRSGNIGKAYSFSNGAQYIAFPAPPANTFTNSMSYSIWYKEIPNTDYVNIFNTTGNKALVLNPNGNGIRANDGNSFYLEANNSALRVNGWKHICAVYQGQAISVYINGVLAASGTTGFSATIQYPSTQSIVGTTYLGGGQYPFSGVADDIAIYNRALTQSEITGLYNAGTNTCLPSYLPTTGLVGYWPFCGNANDESGNGNNGTVYGATLTTDRFGNAGKAYSFNGQLNSNGSKIQTSFQGILGSSSRSISVWVKRSQLLSNHSAILEWGNPTIAGGSTGIFMSNIASNNPYIGIENGTSYVGNQFSSILDGNWHNYIFVYDNAISNNLSGVKIYIDNVLVSNNVTYGNSNLNNQQLINLVIGQFYPGQDNRTFYGDIDDLAIYNRALTPNEISNLYNASAPSSCIANITNNDTTICTGQSVTLNASAVSSASFTDINGNVYPTINIGSQTWMQKNLNVSKYKNGDVIPQVTDPIQWANLTTGAWCWFNNDSATYAATYGKLYNWYAVNDPRGLAPEGWHVPSMFEFGTMVKYLDNNADTTTCNTCTSSIIAGGKLKENGTSHWLSPNTGANNTSGFTALAAGSRIQNGQYLYNNMYASFWSSTIQDLDKARDIQLFYQYESSLVDNHIKKNGQSVRLVKDINSSTYLWSTGATTPSITVTPTSTTTYYLTVTDANGNTCRDSVKVTVNTAIPATPGSITGATDVCSSFSSTTAAVSNAVTYSIPAMSTATSYTWTVPAGVTLVSGQGTNSISVTFANSFLSGVISVKANNACGSSTAARSVSVYKRVAATPGVIQKEFSPTSIAAVTSVCGLASEVYRIRKVTYATSYNWSLALGTNATITHLNASGINDTAIQVTFASGFVRDTIRVTAQTPCSVSALRTVVLNATVAPPAVTAITTVAGNFTVCIGSSITITALSTVPTASQSAIQYFRWTKPANTTITSASSDSARITLRIDAGFTGGSVSAKTASACGFYGAAKTATLQYLPPTPSAISASTGSYNACIGNAVIYSVLVSQALSSQSVATVFRWTKPANTTITSATADSSTITLQFNAGFAGGSLTVKGQSSCGAQGASYSQVLTHGGCPAGTKGLPYTTNDGANTKLMAQLFPNPTTSAFNLKVTGNNALPVVAIVRDAEGRLMKSFTIKTGELANFGNDLTPGVYMIELMQGDARKVLRGVRM